MLNRTANLLGAVGLAVADRVEDTARDILRRVGETPAALVVIGYGLGPSNDQLRQVLGLSHPGAVRLVDRLVEDGLVERLPGRDKRAIALHLTRQGRDLRKKLLRERLAAIRPFLEPLTEQENSDLAVLLERILSSLQTTDLQRCTICRLCDAVTCIDCPIPAKFRDKSATL